LRILLVEDDLKHANLFFYALEDMGLERKNTHWVENSDQALESLDSQSFQLALVDLLMPGSTLDGIALTKAIKERNPEIFVVLFTVSRDEQDKEAAIAAGANFFLSKPFDFDELLTALNSIFTHVEQR
ncbi:MAG: response regulator, partial [Bacteroidota bacterium]